MSTQYFVRILVSSRLAKAPSFKVTSQITKFWSIPIVKTFLSSGEKIADYIALWCPSSLITYFPEFALHIVAYFSLPAVIK